MLLLLRVPLKRDLNDDGVVTEAEDAEAQARSRTLRSRIVLATAVFALPCIMLTSSLVKAADDATPDSFGATSTAEELVPYRRGRVAVSYKHLSLATN